jgi:CRP/FNR family transcriptional regulator
MYVIQEGQVEVLIKGEEDQDIRLGVRQKGEFIGEMAIFDRDVRSATVRALGQARVLTVDKKNFMRRVHEDPSLAFRLVETMSHRIRELSDEVARLKQVE